MDAISDGTGVAFQVLLYDICECLPPLLYQIRMLQSNRNLVKDSMFRMLRHITSMVFANKCTLVHPWSRSRYTVQTGVHYRQHIVAECCKHSVIHKQNTADHVLPAKGLEQRQVLCHAPCQQDCST